MAEQNWAFVAAAYVATWIMILGYWAHVHAAVRRARRAYDHATAAPASRPGEA
ncbi:MAG TPA: hypothetical protein VJL28_02160 [Gemmatimonadaceae bacterium]|nr:hypothetical protein [Gemmatimonadaceae bacterium]